MKFSLSIILATAAAIVFSSCSKDKVAQPTAAASASIQTYFKFDGNLTDSTGNISSAIPTGAITYGNDRHGNAGKALYLDGAAKIVFPGFILKGNSMTMSAWVKYGTPGAGLQFILTANTADGGGPALIQYSNTYGLAVSVPTTNNAVSEEVDANWHHVASTYDGINIKVYMDGVLAHTVNHPGTMGNGARDIILGYFSASYWKGFIDDLRIYNSVLTANDIKEENAL